MTGLSDHIGKTVLEYHVAHGKRAPVRIRDDMSRAIGRRAWDEAVRLQRVKLRFETMAMAGAFDLRPDGRSRILAQGAW